MPPSPFPRPGHDHAACSESALARAETICRGRGARLTPMRRRVLELVWTSHEAVGAYALLERLAEGSQRPAPITVYRALDFLQAHGLIHRVESLNAFVGCSEPGEQHAGQFLICRLCNAVAEIQSEALVDAVDDCGRRHGFEVESPRIELEGLCRHCRELRQ